MIFPKPSSCKVILAEVKVTVDGFKYSPNKFEGIDITPITQPDRDWETNVGNVIYEHGVIILTSGSFINNFITTPNLTCSFQSTVTIYESQYKCTVRQNEFNFSQNPTLVSGSSNSGIMYDYVTGSYFDPYVTTIGLYNNSYELIAVAKLAQPLPLKIVTGKHKVGF